MKTIVNITEFRNNISIYIDKVIYNNETFLLKKGKKIVAEVNVYKEIKKDVHPLLALKGLWKDIDTKKFDEWYKNRGKDDKNRYLQLLK